MAGYSSNLNQGYNEEPGVNWGKVAAYSVGGAMTLGAGKMAINQARRPNSSFRRGLKRGGGWAAEKAKATPGYIGGKAWGVAKWGGRQAKSGAGWLGGTKAGKFGARLAGVDTIKGAHRMAKGAIRNAGLAERFKGTPREALHRGIVERASSAFVDRATTWASGKDFAAKGAKRWAVAGLRVGGSLGVAAAALDFVNPFSLGWND